MNTIDFEQWLDELSQGAGLFMTGTDTGVGKTWVGTQLLQHLRLRGRQLKPRKPVESGWLPEQITETDTWKLAICATNFQRLNLICANPLTQPLSPPRAAILERKSLSIQALVQACRQQTQASDFLYVEGAGGFYSPLAHDGLNADLAEQLGLPVLIVSLDRVGALNHILLCYQALIARRLNLAGIILNAQQPATPYMDNVADLRALLPSHVPIWRWQDHG